MRVAITRSMPEAEHTAARVRELRGEPVMAPLLHIAPRAFDTNVEDAQALLFTSAAGVRAFAAASAARDPNALCVGNATAEAARVAGFKRIASADGDATALAHLAVATLAADSGPVLHISGADIALDIVSELSVAGFTAERRIAYEAVAATSLPAALTQSVDLVLFHSARAAAIFIQLGAPRAAQVTAVCLSQTVADAAAIAPWKQILVAPFPRDDALLTTALPPEGANA